MENSIWVEMGTLSYFGKLGVKLGFERWVLQALAFQEEEHAQRNRGRRRTKRQMAMIEQKVRNLNRSSAF